VLARVQVLATQVLPSLLAAAPPEIDVIKAEKVKNFTNDHVVSQSAQSVPFTHGYTYLNDSGQ